MNKSMSNILIIESRLLFCKIIKQYSVFFLLFSLNFTFCQTTFIARVVGIKDGDTVVVLDSLNNQTTLRLAEIDCPENSQPFGNKAKQFTSQEIYRKQIKYVVSDIDRYGRSIAMIYYDDNKYLSAELIKNGLAWHYKRYSISEKLANFENSARLQKVGLWYDKKPIEPWEWRRNK